MKTNEYSDQQGYITRVFPWVITKQPYFCFFFLWCNNRVAFLWYINKLILAIAFLTSLYICLCLLRLIYPVFLHLPLFPFSLSLSYSPLSRCHLFSFLVNSLTIFSTPHLLHLAFCALILSTFLFHPSPPQISEDY